MGMFEGVRVTEGKDGRHGTIMHTYARGWVTVLWDDGWRGLVHVSTLWYE